MQIFVTLDGAFQNHLLRTSSGSRSGPQVTNQGYPGLSPFIWKGPWPVPPPPVASALQRLPGQECLPPFEDEHHIPRSCPALH